MINKKEHYVAWAHLAQELEDAREHLESLVRKVVESGSYTESEFAVDLGHVYAHLNRAWHSRNQTSEVASEQWEDFS